MYRYLQGALVADGDNETRETVETASNRRGSRDYVPCSKPGSRLPHMQLKMLNASSSEVLCLFVNHLMSGVGRVRLKLK